MSAKKDSRKGIRLFFLFFVNFDSFTGLLHYIKMKKFHAGNMEHFSVNFF